MAEPAPPWEEVLFSWIHVSDIHIGHGDAAHGWDQKIVLETLRQDVEQLLKDERVPSANAILVTGDIAFSGATRAADEYARAAQWLNSLAKVAGLDASKVFVVPGNHDVQRTVDTRDRDVGRLVRGLRSGEDSLDSALAHLPDVALLSKRLANYLAFARDFGPPRSETDIVKTPFYWRHVLGAKHGLKVCLAGLNTALLAADDQDRGKLRLGKAQVADGLLDPDVAQVVVLLSHHPFVDGWLKDEHDVSNSVQNLAHVHLSGHVHAAHAEQVVSGGGASFLRITAGAAHGEADRSLSASHGYNLGALVRSKSGKVDLAVWPRRWSQKNGMFRTDVENVPDGAMYSVHPIRGVTVDGREMRGGRGSVEAPGDDPHDVGDRLEFGDSRLTSIVVDAAIHPADRRGLREELRRACREDRLFPTKLFYATEDGASRWLALTRDPSYAFYHSSIGTLRSNATSIADAIAEHVRDEMPDLVSLGSGDGEKDTILLNAIHDRLGAKSKDKKVNYFPIDYSYFLVSETIQTFGRRVAASKYRIKPIVGDLLDLQSFRYVYEHFPNPDLFSILGNTIGNNDERALLDAIRTALRPNGWVLIEVNTDVASLTAPSNPDFVEKKLNLLHNFTPLEELGYVFEESKFKFRVTPGLSGCPDAMSIETLYQLDESTLIRVAINHRYDFRSFCAWAAKSLASEEIWSKEEDAVGLALFKRKRMTPL